MRHATPAGLRPTRTAPARAPTAARALRRALGERVSPTPAPATPASSRPPAPAAPVDEGQRRALGALFGTLARARLILVPLVAALPGWLVYRDPAPWRIYTVLAVFAGLVTVSAVELLRYRRGGLRRWSFEFNLGFNAAAASGIIVATGGIESPVAPGLPLLAMLGAMLGLPRSRGFFLAVETELAALTVFQYLGLGPGLPESLGPAPVPVMLLARALVLAGTSAGMYLLGRRLRVAVDAILAESAAARDEALRTYLDQSRTLTTLSAEIAHELKNPLASIKGLAALLDRGAGLSGRQAEHLSVLRREADRMQGVLEEFLNYSRPLVPLTQERCELGALCDEVVALHDGMAHERGVGLGLDAGSVEAFARCDRRKVKQVLVNLVQNALEASAPGGRVRLRVSNEGERVVVTVRDEGAGVRDDVLSRAFEPGVTTKPRGSGLGLTVARALARQHGGEVTLRAMDGGGCEAELALPAAGAGEEV